MSVELNLRFPDPQHVIVKWGDSKLTSLDFQVPLTAKERHYLAWYLETYASHYTTAEDDAEAARIAAQLPIWGQKLCAAAFSDSAAAQYFQEFQQTNEAGRLLTISAEHPAILGLPWELLHTLGADGAFLYDEKPPIAVRRRVADAERHKPAEAKERLHLLFVISRPLDAGFLDPRSDATAVLDAIDAHASGRVTVEFLRPATFRALRTRLDNKDLPPVDILHFDGHGTFDERTQTGYLLFENQISRKQLIAASEGTETGLGFLLKNHGVSLIILSACQTGAYGDDKTQDDSEANDESGALGSVAAGLMASGVPAVLAMSHSVLVPTTQRLFGKFYECLAQGDGIGAALEAARQHLRNDARRRQVQRGTARQWLQLQDWCVPALYQSGDDAALLRKEDTIPTKVAAPQQGAFFCGRAWELWALERAFTKGAQCVTVTGFAGQGKTWLVQEAGRWLHRARMFELVVFVSPASANDPTLANRIVALRATLSLLILDDIENLPDALLTALLNAANISAPDSKIRLLTTARPQGFLHPLLSGIAKNKHEMLALNGFASYEALDLFQFIYAPREDTVPPARDELISLFGRVHFHPQCVRVLARALNQEPLDDVEKHWEELLLSDTEDNPRAAVEQAIAKLDPELRDKWLPRLGVFQGGAMEDTLLVVTKLGQMAERPDIVRARRLLAALEAKDIEAAARLIATMVMMTDLPEEFELPPDMLENVRTNAAQHVRDLHAELSQFPQSAFAEGADETTWPQLKSALFATALIEENILPYGGAATFFKFHPTLAPTLWAQLTTTQRDELDVAHRHCYYDVARALYSADQKSPHVARAIAQQELPNLLHAVWGALEAGDDTSPASAIDFVTAINRFLSAFGLNRDAAELNERRQSLFADSGIKEWYVVQSAQAEQLRAMGRVEEAAEAFSKILAALGTEPTFQMVLTLANLGRCLKSLARPDLAAHHYLKGLQVAEELEQNADTKLTISVLQMDLGDVMADMGHFAQARAAYESTLIISKELNHPRSEAVVNGQMGSLAFLQGDFQEAGLRYNTALHLFQQLNEPIMEATARHKLGLVFLQTRQWDKAETCFRNAAEIHEAHGNIIRAADSWGNLGYVCRLEGKFQAAEHWYSKVEAIARQANDQGSLVTTLIHLATLLQNQSGRLPEAQQRAKEALEISLTLNPDATQIWETYELLAQINDKSGEVTKAREYRQQARQAYRNYAGSQHQMQRFAPLIEAVAAAVEQPHLSGNVKEVLMRMAPQDYINLVIPIRRIWEGERDVETLCERDAEASSDPLDFRESWVIETILARLAAQEKPKRGFWSFGKQKGR